MSDSERHEPVFEPGVVRVLAAVFINSKECSKKIYCVCSVEQLIDCVTSEQPDFYFERVQKYNRDFQEFVDVEKKAGIKSFDKFQVFLSGKQGQPRPSAGEACQIEHVSVPNNSILESILQSKSPGILEEHKKTGTITIESRRLLVKVCVSHLVEKHGFYPSSAEKLTLARQIITYFPSLKVQIEGKGEGFEHFYDPHSRSGFLEMRLRNIRRKLEASQRRYLKRKVGCDVGPASEDEQGESSTSVTSEWVTLMKRLRPTTENMPSIKSAMEKTYTRRRSWISKESPTLTEIFNEYPRFLDVPSLMDVEFAKMTDGKTDLFIRRWEARIIPKLKAVITMEGGDLASLIEGIEDKTDDEKCYIMLVVLTHLLPPLPGSRCSVKSAVSFLIDFVPSGTSIASLCSNPEMTTRTQPQLICIGSFRNATRQFVIIARNDGVTIPVDDGLTCAVDKLFKLYWVCNVSYPPQLSSVFTFFEYIYDVPMSTNRRAKVLELISKLQAVQ